MPNKKTTILNHEQIRQKINRIAYEILENNFEEKEIIIAGIANNGYVFAKRIEDALKKISSLKTKLIELKIDKENPYNQKIKPLEHNKLAKGKVILVVDDVLNSGKTMIYGLKLFLNVPVKKIETVVLVNRAHHRYPVNANYVGLTLSTTLQEHISVEFNTKGKDLVYLS